MVVLPVRRAGTAAAVSYSLRSSPSRHDADLVRYRCAEEQVKFYASEVILVLEYIHSKGYIYRGAPHYTTTTMIH